MFAAVRGATAAIGPGSRRVVGCGTTRSHLRYGSLKPDERTLSYKPRRMVVLLGGRPAEVDAALAAAGVTAARHVTERAAK